MRYAVSYNTSMNETYVASDTSFKSVHTYSDAYDADTLEHCKEIIKMFLDIPECELSLDVVKKDFSTPESQISEEEAIRIQNYYNGRLALYNTIMDELDKNTSWTILKYDIPAKYNSFNIVDDDEQLYSKIIIQKI